MGGGVGAGVTNGVGRCESFKSRNVCRKIDEYYLPESETALGTALALHKTNQRRRLQHATTNKTGDSAYRSSGRASDAAASDAASETASETVCGNWERNGRTLFNRRARERARERQIRENYTGVGRFVGGGVGASVAENKIASQRVRQHQAHVDSLPAGGSGVGRGVGNGVCKESRVASPVRLHEQKRDDWSTGKGVGNGDGCGVPDAASARRCAPKSTGDVKAGAGKQSVTASSIEARRSNSRKSPVVCQAATLSIARPDNNDDDKKK